MRISLPDGTGCTLSFDREPLLGIIAGLRDAWKQRGTYPTSSKFTIDGFECLVESLDYKQVRHLLNVPDEMPHLECVAEMLGTDIEIGGNTTTWVVWKHKGHAGRIS